MLDWLQTHPYFKDLTSSLSSLDTFKDSLILDIALFCTKTLNFFDLSKSSVFVLYLIKHSAISQEMDIFT